MSRVLARVLIISAFTALHFVVSVGALISSLAMGMARFETGPGGLESYEPPTTTEHVLDTMVDVLLSPFSPCRGCSLRCGSRRRWSGWRWC